MVFLYNTYSFNTSKHRNHTLNHTLAKSALGFSYRFVRLSVRDKRVTVRPDNATKHNGGSVVPKHNTLPWDTPHTEFDTKGVGFTPLTVKSLVKKRRGFDTSVL